MKRYVKNKKFIPSNFIEKLDNQSNEKNNKLILVLIIINILIIPNSISKLSNNIKNNEVVPAVNINNEYENSNKEKLILLLNAISNSISNINISNNIGIIEFDSIEEIYSIEEQGSFKIKSLDMNKDNIFTVEVELWKENISYIV